MVNVGLPLSAQLTDCQRRLFVPIAGVRIEKMNAMVPNARLLKIIEAVSSKAVFDGLLIVVAQFGVPALFLGFGDGVRVNSCVTLLQIVR